MKQLGIGSRAPLAWVLSAIDKIQPAAVATLAHLCQQQADGPDLAGEQDLGMVRQVAEDLHEVAGALAFVQQERAAMLVQSMERLVARKLEEHASCTAGELSALRSADLALREYLREQLTDRARSAVGLFPQYQRLAEFNGADRIHPADLWEHAWVWPDASLDTIAGGQSTTDQGLQQRLDRGVLLLLQGDASAAAELMDCALAFQSLFANNSRITDFWNLAAAMFEAVTHRRLALDLYIKRILSRISLQARSFFSGDQPGSAVSETLCRDLLFFCWQSLLAEDSPKLPHVQLVRERWGLSTRGLCSYREQVFGQYDPDVLNRARRRVDALKENWSTLAGGDLSRLDVAHEQLLSVCDVLERLHEACGPLSQTLRRLVRQLTRTRRVPAAEVAMETATTLLFLEASFEDFRPQGRVFKERVEVLAARLEDVQDGGPLRKLEPWMEQLFRQVSDRQSVSTIVTELAATLEETEGYLDQFFRVPHDRAPLLAALPLFETAHGVLSVLGVDAAALAVKEMGMEVGRIQSLESADDADALASIFGRLATNFGTLRFLIDTLNYQPALARELFEYDRGQQQFVYLGERVAVADGASDAKAASGTGHDTVATRESTDYRDMTPGELSQLSSEAALEGKPTLARAAADAARIAEHGDDSELSQAMETLASAAAPASPGAPKAEVREMDDDAQEMLEIFLDEAREVVVQAQAAITALKAMPADQEQLTELRRGFHTLKGSARMVGLQEFGEAAWAMEQLLNTWLSRQQLASGDLLGVAMDGLNAFGDWVNVLGEQGDWTSGARPFRRMADALRLDGVRMSWWEAAAGDRSGEGGEASQGEGGFLESLATSVAEDPPIPDVPSDARLIESAVDPDMLDASDHGEFMESRAGDQQGADDTHPVLRDLPEFPPELRGGASGHQAWPDDVEHAGLGEPETEDPKNVDEGHAVSHDLPESPPALEVGASGHQALPDDVEHVEFGEPETEDLQNADEGHAVSHDSSGFLSSWEPEAPSHEIPPDEMGPVEPKVDDLQNDADSGHDSEPAAGVFDALDLVLSDVAPLTEDGHVSSEAESEDASKPIMDLNLDLDLSGHSGSDHLEPETPEPVISTSKEAGDAETPEQHEELLAQLPDFPDLELTGLGSLDDEDVDVVLPSATEVPGSDDSAGNLRHVGDLEISTALYHAFLEEAEDWSQALSGALADWSEQPEAMPVPEVACEAAHALAGSAATIGLAGMSSLARSVEHAIQRLREQTCGDAVQARILVAASDEIRRVLHQFAAGLLKEPQRQIGEAVEQLAPNGRSTVEGGVAAADAGTSAMPARQPGHVVQPVGLDDRIDPDLFPIFEEEAADLLPELSAVAHQWLQSPTDTSLRAAVRRGLHTIKGSARLVGAYSLGSMAHDTESLIGGMADEDDVSRDGIVRDAVAHVDALGYAFERLRAAVTVARAGHAGVEAEPSDVLERDRPGGSLHGVAGPVPLRQSELPAIQHRTVRIKAMLLDHLLALAGEMLGSRARLKRNVAQLRVAMTELTSSINRLRRQLRDVELQAETQMQSRFGPQGTGRQGYDPLELDRFTRMQELTRMMAEAVDDVATIQRSLRLALERSEDDLAAQSRQSRELQHELLRTRMIPFQEISERLQRLVQLAASDTHKRAELKIRGSQLEMDRAILERMLPAFEHLLRNCVVHGVESPQERVQSGKNATGLLEISVQQQGNDVAITFRDDGRGLDLKQIREHAVLRGLIDEGDSLDEQALSQLVFVPGFTTAETVSELAGRGVGMDVVRTEVQALGGKITVATQNGRGTQFQIVLPLTTAVTNVVLMRAQRVLFGVPSYLLEATRRPSVETLNLAYREGRFADEGVELPFFWAGALLQQGLRGQLAEDAQVSPVLVFRSATQRVAVHVDEVLGNQEVVIKALGPQLSRLPGLVATSALMDGSIILIYNPVALATVYGDEARAEAMPVRTGWEPGEPNLQEPVEAAEPLILVVDDSITVRRVTQRLLERAGYRVALAADGQQGLQALENEVPQVILSDIEMPKMDGFEFLEKIRSSEAYKHVPVVMITSRSAQKHREHAQRLGANHYLGKPYSDRELLDLLRNYCARNPS